MTLEEAIMDVTGKNQSVSNRITIIMESIKEYRDQMGLEPLTLQAITAEAVEVDVLWTA